MAGNLTTSTQATHEGGEFPPFATQTYPQQFFWLGITFAVLLLAMWRFGVKGIGGTIAARKGKIDGDLAAAEAHRKDAEAASLAYDTALAAARTRAQTLAEENRRRISGEVERARADAEAKAADAMAKADTEIAAAHEAARGHVTKAAQEAAVEIVARLLGETVPASEAAAAVGSATGGRA